MNVYPTMKRWLEVRKSNLNQCITTTAGLLMWYLNVAIYSINSINDMSKSMRFEEEKFLLTVWRIQFCLKSADAIYSQSFIIANHEKITWYVSSISKTVENAAGRVCCAEKSSIFTMRQHASLVTGDGGLTSIKQVRNQAEGYRV